MFVFLRHVDAEDNKQGCAALSLLTQADTRIHEAVNYCRQGPASAAEIAQRAPRLRQCLLQIVQALELVRAYEKPQPQDVTPSEWQKLIDWANKAQS